MGGGGGVKALLSVGCWRIILSLVILFENLNPFPKFLIANSLIPETPWEHNTGSETPLFMISYITIHSEDECCQRLLEFGNLQLPCIYRAVKYERMFLPLFCKGWSKWSFQILIKCTNSWRFSMIYIPFCNKKIILKKKFSESHLGFKEDWNKFFGAWVFLTIKTRLSWQDISIKVTIWAAGRFPDQMDSVVCTERGHGQWEGTVHPPLASQDEVSEGGLFANKCSPRVLVGSIWTEMVWGHCEIPEISE